MKLRNIEVHEMKWYEQKYVNHRDWLLDNMELLNLSHTDLIVVLLIDFLNEHQIMITTELLSEKTKLSTHDLDMVLGGLCAKKYLDIRVKGSKVNFSLNGLFDTDIARETQVMDSPLFDVFETEFGRPLTQLEMQKINEWNRIYDKQMIIYALRSASAYQKLNFSYIDRILANWRDKNVSLEMIETGKYVD